MNALPDPLPGHLWVVVLPRRAPEIMLHLAARLARHTRLRVFDGGNSFNAYTVANLLRRQTANVETALERIQVARAFTCYQMLALLERAPSDASPVLALDLLSTFYDESVSPAERRRLLEKSIAELRRLSRQAPAAVSACLPRPGHIDPVKLLETLQEAADQVWRFEPRQPVLPPRLF